MQLRRWLLVLGVVLGSAALAACGGDDDANDDSRDPADEGEQPTDESPDDEAGVPDACEAFDAADLSAAFGDVGTGTPNSVVDSRTVCTYENGTIVGVSEANQFEPSVSAASNISECDEVSGVGDKATFCVTGGTVGQLMWVDGDLMFDVTAAKTDSGPFEELAGQAKV